LEEQEKEQVYEDELVILPEIIKLFKKINPNSIPKLLRTISTYFGRDSLPHNREIKMGDFSEDRTLSPKEFIVQKNPQNDIEKVVCLAYYLTHYRDMEVFSNVDISKLNQEASQLKFSNSSYAVNNAINKGFIINIDKGLRKISVFGEQFVQKLPDRDAAKSIMKSTKSKRKKVKQTNKEKSAEQLI